MINYAQITFALLPEIFVLIGILAVLFFDLGNRGHPLGSRNVACIIISTISLVLAGLAICLLPNYGEMAGGMLIITPLARLAKAAVLVLAAFTIWISARISFTAHIGEYFSMLLLCTIGFMLMCGTRDLLVAFLSLELASLSLYILTAFNKQNRHSAEAAMKYFLFGSVAAAFTLFGLSYLYGLCGGTGFSEIRAALNSRSASAALLLAVTMVIIGFAFKVAIVPFHLWAPDAYQGAPIPSAAFIGSASKLASFVLFGGLFLYASAGPKYSALVRLDAPLKSFEMLGFETGWQAVLAILALLSMVFGNLLAIAQSNFRRLLAYSAIAHGGYTLLGFLGKTTPGFHAVIFYAATYGLTIIGLFAIAGLLEREHGEVQITDFAGLAQREPLLGACLMILILSLAGIPPLAGFFGKFYLFTSAVQLVNGSLQNLWLVVVAIAASAVSLYYYLQVLKQAYVLPSKLEQAAPIPSDAKVPIVLLASLVLLLGCFPNLLLKPLTADNGTNEKPPMRMSAD